ncbi:MAG: rhamnulokinase [Bacteroidales bacterium]|nr:rhamnulokinase [Bacteroidales bacterium]
MEKFYIAVDLGATSGRVILARVEDGKFTMEVLHRFPTPLIEDGGTFHWDINVLFKEIVCGLGKASGRKIESIGIDTWGVDFCCVNSDGSVRNPRAYRDPYTNGVPELFFKEMPRRELYARTGIQIMNFNTVFQLYAQKREGSLEGASRLLFTPDALSYMLTGNMVCEYTILSTSALMNPRTREFDPDILKVCGVERGMFADIVLPGTVVGTLKDEIAEKTGLGKVKVVAVAGHDTASAVAAVPARDGRFAYLSSGTWSLMGVELPEPLTDENSFALNFTNEGGAAGNIRFLKNITGMWLLEQCLAQWRKEGKDYSYARVAQMAREVPASAALLDPDAPEFASPQDMPAAIRSYMKENAPQTDAQLIRLIYDSLAAKYAQVLDNLREITPIDTLHIIGGGSQNELLDQMTADACRVKVIAGPSEGTALGNIMIQSGLTRQEIYQSIDTKTFIPE